MIKVKQTKLHNPPETIGNCFAAVIASFLSCSIDEVPAIEDVMDNGTTEWEVITQKFLNSKGYLWCDLDGHRKGHYIVIGKSPRGFNHCCIYKDGKLWHDPHPDNTGLTTEEYFEYIGRFNEFDI